MYHRAPPDVPQNEWDLCVPLGWGCLPQDMLLTRKSSGWEMVMVTLHARVCLCVCACVRACVWKETPEPDSSGHFWRVEWGSPV